MIKTTSLFRLLFVLMIAFVINLVSCSPKILDPGNTQLLSNKKFSDEDIAKLKQTKTVFFYGQEKGAQLDSLKQALSQAWDLTPIIFAPYTSFDSYTSDPSFSYFAIEGVSIGETTPNNLNNPYGPKTTRYVGVTYYLSLRLIIKISKRGNASTKQLCRIELSPNVATIRYGDVNRKANEIVDDLYEKGKFFNRSPVLLKAQIGAVCADLKRNRFTGIAEEFKKENISQLLSADTLYVPKGLLTTLNGITAKEGEKDENVFNSYKFKYRICSDSELFDIFVKQQRGRFLFEFVRCSATKIINVYDVQQKEVIYRNYTNVSYNIKEKDIEKIK